MIHQVPRSPHPLLPLTDCTAQAAAATAGAPSQPFLLLLAHFFVSNGVTSFLHVVPLDTPELIGKLRACLTVSICTAYNVARDKIQLCRR